MMNIKVTLFGRLSDFQNCLPATIAIKDPGCFRDLLTQIKQLDPQLAQQIASTTITLACNNQIVDIDKPLVDGDQVALLPPVTGG